jgi:hypothetical protein
MSVRAKFRCQSVEMTSEKPVVQTRYVGGESTEATVWPRTFRFQAVYDMSVPEDQRYATATPYAELKMNVDNPAVSFEPGQCYYVDFTPAE